MSTSENPRRERIIARAVELRHATAPATWARERLHRAASRNRRVLALEAQLRWTESSRTADREVHEWEAEP